MSRRLIEDWLPISEIGIESIRERTPMTPFPAPNRLHVWWARRPLVASRAAILGALLPANVGSTLQGKQAFMQTLGIHGDPVAARKRIESAKQNGDKLGPDPYGYQRSYKYTPSPSDRSWILGNLEGSSIGVPAIVFDPTAGGGSIPLEASRLGFETIANDINPVAAFLLKQTVQTPLFHGGDLIRYY
jgi:adenine-specific DNA methylase